jgi:uncharacterized protein
MKSYHIENIIPLKEHKLSYWFRMFMLLSTAICNGYFFSWLINYLSLHTNQKELHALSKVDLFLMIAFWAPIAETVIFQYIPIELIVKKFKSKWISILVSALLFCSIHFYNYIYVVMTFFAGIILGIAYFESKKHSRWAIVHTICFHSAYNVYGFLFVN